MSKTQLQSLVNRLKAQLADAYLLATQYGPSFTETQYRALLEKLTEDLEKD